MNAAKIQEIFDFLSTKTLVGWDLGFVESVTDFFERHQMLSERQWALLCKIKDKFSPEAVKQREEWAKEYRDKHLDDAKVVATYYIPTGYFTALARDILHEPEFVPSKRQWEKLAENKYAQKVLETFHKQQDYAPGDLVCFSETAEFRILKRRHKLTSNAAVVVEYLKEVVSPAKGAKPLMVLPVGAIRALKTEERYLKKFRKQKKK